MSDDNLDTYKISLREALELSKNMDKGKGLEFLFIKIFSEIEDLKLIIEELKKS